MEPNSAVTLHYQIPQPQLCVCTPAMLFTVQSFLALKRKKESALDDMANGTRAEIQRSSSGEAEGVLRHSGKSDVFTLFNEKSQSNARVRRNMTSNRIKRSPMAQRQNSVSSGCQMR